MKTIYKTKESLNITLELYDKQISKLDCEFKDIYLNTSFGKTHLIEIGNLTGIPLLVFHGGNSTTAYNLLMCRFLLKDFHIYAVDTIELVCAMVGKPFAKTTGSRVTIDGGRDRII